MDLQRDATHKRRRFSPAVASAANPNRGIGTQLVYGTVEIAAGSTKQQVTIAGTADVRVTNVDPIDVRVANTAAIKVDVDNQPLVRLCDGVGNTVASTEGSLDVNITNGPFVRLGDAEGAPLGSELGALKVGLHAADGSTLDTTEGALNVAVPSAVKLADGTGNLLVATAGALTVSVSNEPSVRIVDSTGNQIKTTGGALDVSGPVRLNDGFGNAISSVDGLLSVTVGTPVTVAGSLAEDYSYYFNTELPSAWTSPFASCAITSGETQLVGSFGGSGTQYPGQIFNGIATTVSIESTSEEDTLSGSGAKQVRITGLSGSYTLISEVVTLTGSTPVSTSNTYIYVMNLQVIEAGALGSNEGILTVESPAPSSLVLLSASALAGYADSGSVFVPATHEYFLQSVSVFSHITGTLNVRATALKTGATQTTNFALGAPGQLILPLQLSTPMQPVVTNLNAVIPGPAMLFAVVSAGSTGTVGVSFTGYMQ